ncbi:unnamed protein product [Leptosia nina]|uniref:Uncharacterized protein n=1 Tax=Leptosia nina TaxID=320188 RepID=A0AAV1JB86_9NEOP
MSESLVLLLFIACVHGAAIWETPSNLQPVHGLYVKPSIDGTTGDLYVAATEDNGVNSQWLTDQPINFLAAASEIEPSILPAQEETLTQKRAIITTPSVNYAYAIPTAGAEASVINPYTLAVSGVEESKAQCSNAPVQPHYSPFQFFYPQMLSTIANAFNAYKDPTKIEGSTTQAQPVATWPHTYALPFQYVMVDPNAWASQTASTITKTPESDS